ncbi:MAG: hypothetical protein ABIU96_03980 [Rhodanobacter sp.]
MQDEARVVARLDEWASLIATLDKQMNALESIVGRGESSLSVAVMDLQSSYTDVVAELVGDRWGLLDWYYMQNELGRKGATRQARGWKKPRRVKSSLQLARLIGAY